MSSFLPSTQPYRIKAKPFFTSDMRAVLFALHRLPMCDISDLCLPMCDVSALCLLFFLNENTLQYESTVANESIPWHEMLSFLSIFKRHISHCVHAPMREQRRTENIQQMSEMVVRGYQQKMYFKLNLYHLKNEMHPIKNPYQLFDKESNMQQTVAPSFYISKKNLIKSLS